MRIILSAIAKNFRVYTRFSKNYLSIYQPNWSLEHGNELLLAIESRLFKGTDFVFWVVKISTYYENMDPVLLEAT